MADVPDSIGWMEVKGRMLLGDADSLDPGDAPDARPAIAKVTISANAPTPLVAVEEQILIAISPIPCLLDASGELVAPADGVSDDGEVQMTPGVRLVAPIQPSLSDIGWMWTATFRPIAPQAWSGFAISFTGKPGDIVNLASLSLIASTTALTKQPVVWSTLSTETVPTLARAGQFVYYTDSGELFLIGAI